MNFQAALNFLLAGEELVLTTHVHADGDGLGALLGLSHWLTRQDQKHRIVVADETPDRKYRFLPGYDRIESVYCPIPVVPRLVVVDTTTSKKRIGDVANLIGPATKTLVIDHHVNDRGGGRCTGDRYRCQFCQ